MTNSRRGPIPWPDLPGIPIYLDVQDDRSTLKTYGTTPTTPTSPEVMSRVNPPRLDTTHLSIEPYNIPSATTIQTSSERSVIWPIPEPPPEVIQQHQSRRPLLRYFPADRPRVRLDEAPATSTNNFNQIKAEDKPRREVERGLGIQDAQYKAPTIQIQPPHVGKDKQFLEEMNTEKEKIDSNSNIAQRFEEKIWNWNSSNNVVQRWSLEIASWLISAICMGSIVAALIVLRDQPLSKWPFSKAGLTLNAFISICSRVAGAALLLPVAEALGQLKWNWFIKGGSKKMWDFEMFDNASRGPWGAFLLLIHTKGKTIAALGALVTIFCLAMDPFFQQVFDLQDRWTLQHTNSSIPRVVRYEPDYPIEMVSGVRTTQYDNDLLAVADPFFLGNGTQPTSFGNGTRPNIPLSCPTSKCVWPAYNTLGMCSQCVETSQILDFTCVFMTVDWTSTLNSTVSSYPNATVCGYFLNATSEAPVLMSGYIADKAGNSSKEALLMRTLPLITNPNRTSLWEGSINFRDIRNPIVDVLISSVESGAEVYANKTPTLHECVLSWCVKTIQSSYVEATYHEEVTRIFINDTGLVDPWFTHFYQDGSVYTEYRSNITIDAPSTGQNFSKYGWGVNYLTMINTVTIFDRIFPAFTTVANISAKPALRWRNGLPGPVRTRQLNWNPWLTPNNLTRHIERLADAMSDALRSSSSTEMVSGQSFDKETYVLVRWSWLSLPVGLLLVSFIFLLATVVKSAIEKDLVGIRKNSAIATLLYGLPDHYQKRLVKSNSKRTPRAKAKELKVKLSPTKGWRVSGNAFSPLTPTLPRNLPPPGWI